MKEVLRLVVTLEGTEAKLQFSYDTDAAHALGLLELAKQNVYTSSPARGRPVFSKLETPSLTPKRF